MFRSFFHKISTSIREETNRLRTVMHEQMDLPQFKHNEFKDHHK